MESERKELRKQGEEWEQVSEILSDTLSLVILLENDLETQKADDIYARLLRMIHEKIKSIQKNVSAYMRWRENEQTKQKRQSE